MKNIKALSINGGLILALLLSSCQAIVPEKSSGKTIVVTYSILGSVVKDLVGD
jgi:hypothetical protein